MIIFYIFIFILGAIIGSFLNVVIFRLKKGQSIFKKRSHCLFCKRQLTWWELFPIFSFVFQKRKCLGCGKKISWQYPLVEFFTGLIFVLLFYFLFPVFNGFADFRFYIATVFWFIISSFLIIIFVYDFKHYLVADVIIWPAVIIAFLYRTFEVYDLKYINLLLNYIGASLIAGAFFLLIILISKGKWMGLGDAKIGILMGLVLGMPLIFVALFLAFLIGAAVSSVLLIFGKKKLKSEIPFGPFLVFATMISLFCGEFLINWYLGLM